MDKVMGYFAFYISVAHFTPLWWRVILKRDSIVQVRRKRVSRRLLVKHGRIGRVLRRSKRCNTCVPFSRRTPFLVGITRAQTRLHPGRSHLPTHMREPLL